MKRKTDGLTIETGEDGVSLRLDLSAEEVRRLVDINGFICPDDPQVLDDLLEKCFSECENNLRHHFLRQVTEILPSKFWSVGFEKKDLPEIMVSIRCDEYPLYTVDIGPWLVEAPDEEILELAREEWIQMNEFPEEEDKFKIFNWLCARPAAHPELLETILVEERTTGKYCLIDLAETEAGDTTSIADIMEWLAENRTAAFLACAAEDLLPKMDEVQSGRLDGILKGTLHRDSLAMDAFEKTIGDHVPDPITRNFPVSCEFFFASRAAGAKRDDDMEFMTR